ncbi:hypothetical protein EV127DRAFT_404857 [Xylaria flabelliformis]|nr:hypothetical protein EV127DRAFT_404857 [Xylaria flabelliformis]
MQIPGLIVLGGLIGSLTGLIRSCYWRPLIWPTIGCSPAQITTGQAFAKFLGSVCAAHASHAGPLGLSAADVDLYDVLGFRRTREMQVRYGVGGVMVDGENLGAAVLEAHEQTFSGACTVPYNTTGRGAELRFCAENYAKLVAASSVLLDTVERDWYNQCIVPLVDEQRDSMDELRSWYDAWMPKREAKVGGTVLRRSQTGKFENICRLYGASRPTRCPAIVTLVGWSLWVARLLHLHRVRPGGNVGARANR